MTVMLAAQEELEAKWKVLQHVAVKVRLQRVEDGEVEPPPPGWYEEVLDDAGRIWLQPALSAGGALPRAEEAASPTRRGQQV